MSTIAPDSAPEPNRTIPVHATEPARPDLNGPDVVARYLRPGTLSLAGSPPLSVYVHLPWCLRKCPYCDFNSHEAPKLPSVATPRGGSGTGPAEPRDGAPRLPSVATPQGGSVSGPAEPDPRRGLLKTEVPGGGLSPELEARYLAALRADLEASLPLVWGRTVHSVFIGGGTPSLFSPEGIERLISDLRAHLPLNPGCEITLEANPGTFERDRFRAFRAAGVTRLSIGVQSFDDDKLAALGRVHDRAQAIAAAEEAADAFDTFNLDLMYALPGQDMAACEADLRTALALQPPHLSLYHLTIEPNTEFARRPPVVPDDDSAFDMLDRLIERTGAAGFQRYEVSAYAQPGHRCTHNLNYWQFGDYLGLGAGAHSKLSFPHRVVRQVRWREPQMYMVRALAGQAVSNDEEVSRKALPFEFMLNALRLRDGFELALFTDRTGLPPTVLQEALTRAESQGLITRSLDRIAPTPRGFDFLSDLQGLFLA